MAAVATEKQHTPAPAATASTGRPAVMDPKFEWAEKAGSYVLRLELPDFRKDNFRVQVDGAGRLTVRGSRPAAAGQSSLYKVFQLPSTASLDDIAGRFEAGVLTLTVPKRASASDGTAAPTCIEDIKRKPPSVPKEEGVTGSKKKGDADDNGSVKKTDAKEGMGKEDASKKAMEEASNKAQEKKREEEEAKSRKQEQQKPASATVRNEEAARPKSPQAAAAAGALPLKPEAATGTDQAKAAAVDTESLAERVRRQGQEERAKAAAAATAAMKAISEPEKKAATTTSCSSWKERVAGELKGLTDMKWAEGLTDMKWADGVVEAARSNKEMVAVGVAAFSLGFFVSQRLFRK